MKVISQLSGGLDSALSTLLIAESQGVSEFGCVFFDLRQPYLMQEMSSFRYLCDLMRGVFDRFMFWVVVPVNMSLKSEGTGPNEYIPVRNLVLGSLSANLALSRGYDTVAVGSKTKEVRAGDPYSFRDCSVEFYTRLSSLVSFASEGKVLQFRMPLIDHKNGVPFTKREVIEELLKRQIDVSKLCSCYYPTQDNKYCGQCYHCDEVKKTGYGDRFVWAV